MMHHITTAVFVLGFSLSSVHAAAPETTPMEPTQKSFQSVDYPTVADPNRGEYLLGSWELFPSAGMMAMNSAAGVGVGSFLSYRLLTEHRLNLEPGLLVGFLDGNVLFNFMAGLRYEVDLTETWLRPFARVSVGPTLQTEGEDTAVFNAYAGFGIMYPVNKKLDFRADAGLQSVDGNSGFLMTAGIGF